MATEAQRFSMVFEKIGREVLHHVVLLPDEYLNYPVHLSSGNTVFALDTHIAGSTEFYRSDVTAPASFMLVAFVMNYKN